MNDGVPAAGRRAAALANQRAAAFVRFQILGDHEAMFLLLHDLDDHARLGFITAMASITASIGTKAMGEQGTLDYLQVIAQLSASFAEPGHP